MVILVKSVSKSFPANIPLISKNEEKPQEKQGLNCIR